jgi:alkanesulfonate monooxygenase SsuD/methylene tetrahydromethanopterin reductase-like flavin-dependent oxidoreductase (luciferase family)
MNAIDLTSPRRGLGRRPEFGLFLPPEASTYPELVEQARAAERAGFDLIGIEDTLSSPGFLDTFGLIGNLLAKTERLRFFPDVTDLPMRPPWALAKLAASLDLMSGGRFELGLGAGGFLDKAAAMGGPARTRGESIEALEEAIEVLRSFWAGSGPVELQGRHYSIGGVEPGPPPAHPIQLWVGAMKPRMLDLTGRLADGWVASMPYQAPGEIPVQRRRVDEGAARVGRDPSEVRGIYNVWGEISEGAIRAEHEGYPALVGPPSHWIESLTSYVVELGFETLVVWPTRDSMGQLERFAEDVMPGVREAVGAEVGAAAA